MKDVRITISGRDFPAVSKSMVDLGVAFQVEPVEPDEREVESGPPAAPRRRQGKRKTTRSRRSSGSTPEGAAARESPGAARLRAMAERNRAAATGPGGDVQAGEGNLPGVGTGQSAETD
jgi:hypothetical protein